MKIVLAITFLARYIAAYALRSMTASVSNAERVFSFVTSIQTKTRSSMSKKMLEAILRIRIVLKFGEKRCLMKCCPCSPLACTMPNEMKRALAPVPALQQKLRLGPPMQTSMWCLHTITISRPIQSAKKGVIQLQHSSGSSIRCLWLTRCRLP